MSSIIIKPIIDGSTSTPLSPAKFILPTKDSPTAIAVGETATLSFTADGVYFQFLPLATKVVVENATRVSWKSVTPFTAATLVIKDVVDPNADVIITIAVKVKLAPQQVTKPFLIQAGVPVDTRLVLTKYEMRNVVDTYQPEVYFALCKDDGHFYLYNKQAEVSEETGKFTLITDSFKPYNITIDGGEITE
jgi:hypothetical protein